MYKAFRASPREAVGWRLRVAAAHLPAGVSCRFPAIPFPVQGNPGWVVGKNIYLTRKAEKPPTNPLDPRSVAGW